VGILWLLIRSTPGAPHHLESAGFARTHAAVGYPNLMFNMIPIAIRYDG